MFLKRMVMFYVVIYPCIVKGEKNIYKIDSLDSSIRDYSFKRIIQPQSGRVYNIPLPSIFPGMEVFVVRLTSGSFWNRGLNLRFCLIPPKVLARPPVTVFDIVYQSLGNWSTTYFNVPNHTFVAPVVGFSAYYSSLTEANRKIRLTVMGDPIQVHFPNVEVPEYNNVALKCVRFGNNGEIEFSNTTNKNTCSFHSQGHYSILVPIQEPKKKKSRPWKWPVIGFAVGLVAFFLLVWIVVVVHKFFVANTIEKMERESENSEALSPIWIGVSKMPFATGIRTESILEHI